VLGFITNKKMWDFSREINKGSQKSCEPLEKESFYGNIPGNEKPHLGNGDASEFFMGCSQSF
jgi:hypothetical protein